MGTLRPDEEVLTPDMAAGHDTAESLRTSETVELQREAVATVEHRRGNLAVRVFTALNDVRRSAVRYVRSLDVADGMTLDEQDALLAKFDAERRVNTDPTMDFVGHFAGRLSLLMRVLEEDHPELARNPRVRVHLAEKAGLVPYLA